MESARAGDLFPLDQTNQLMAMVENEYREEPALPYLKLALKYGQYVNRAYLEWADEAIAELKSLQEDRTGDGID